MTREIFERGHAVSVVLYDPDLDNLVFIEQFRPGALAAKSSPWFDADFSPWLVETVAGIIGEGETPEQVARREAVEEADCKILELEPVCHYLASPRRILGIRLRFLRPGGFRQRRGNPRPQG